MAKKTAKSRRRVVRKGAASKTTRTAKAAASSKRATAKKRTPKVVARKKGASASAKATARKRPKVKATKKAAASKRTMVKKSVMPKVKASSKAIQRRNPVTSTGEFDFNTWLLPTLELEKYEPHVEEEAGVKDRIKGSTRYAWIGAGQCGGRIVKSFYDLGYRKVIALNTSHHDLDPLRIPEGQKFLMDIGEKGAGKDMERGRIAVQQYRQEILHLARQTFGTKADHIMLCFGAGGGTGSGSIFELIEVAKRYAQYIGMKNPEKNIGVLMTLPTIGEACSPLLGENAWTVATKLSEMAAEGKISPLIIVDNDKINKMYPGMTVKSFWPSINSTVASLFDIFNGLSALASPYTSFDPVDYHSIMEAGGCAIMGLTKVTEFNDKFTLSQAVKKNLEKTLLAEGFDLSTAKVAGCIAVGGKKLMANVQGLQDNLNYAFDVLSEITGRATIHRGIYEDGRNCLRVYTIIGGLETCARRLEELRNLTAVETVG